MCFPSSSSTALSVPRLSARSPSPLRLGPSSWALSSESALRRLETSLAQLSREAAAMLSSALSPYSAVMAEAWRRRDEKDVCKKALKALLEGVHVSSRAHTSSLGALWVFLAESLIDCLCCNLGASCSCGVGDVPISSHILCILCSIKGIMSNSLSLSGQVCGP